MSVQIITGDCIEAMRGMHDRSVRCCITSPPYFGLRDYGHPDQIGLEETPEAFIARLVGVFREVRRVLADDGTLWVNMGDSYATRPNGPRASASASLNGGHAAKWRDSKALRSDGVPAGLKHKDLIGIPWMLAFALRTDGWYLRQDIIWAKTNPMPESVRDRCTKAHEYLFLLSKGPRYYFNDEAIKEQAVTSDRGPNYQGRGQVAEGQKRSRRDSFKRTGSKRAQAIPGQSVGTHREGRDESTYDLGTRNRRSVWTVATRPFKGAHFATFPAELIEPCVLAGCPAGGTVLDPFGGAGTTGLVAQRHGRNAVLCELNPEYAAMAEARIRAERPQRDLFWSAA